jgi:glycosyltransferase involved in cell wall biosynthesis
MKKTISIFLPVHNGGEHFRLCVESILAQTYPGFTLTILENASSDNNIEWIATLSDSRIKVLESNSLLSIEDNWARILQAPKNQYMTIIGHDDLLDPNYLEVMCSLVKEHPDAGLYQAHFRLIDENGKIIRSCVPMNPVEKADVFLESRLIFQRDSYGAGYMFLSSTYEKVGGIPLYKKLMFADDSLWILLIGDSYKATALEECFSCRIHKKSTAYLSGWQSTYTALHSYLDFLASFSNSNQLIAEKLIDRLRNYAFSWIQWGYFSTQKGSKDRKIVEQEIKKLITKTERILSKLGDQEILLEEEVKKKVLGNFAFYRRSFWRYGRWFKRRFPYLAGK